MSENPINNPANNAEITIDAHCLKRLFAAGMVWFERNHEQVNRLNVFPVPDGDTGTNMLLTLKSAYKKMLEASPNAGTEDLISTKADAMATGAVFGSRGNSGTLLSQMFDGFAKAISDAKVINATELAGGFRNAVTLAYKALEKPIEGTILTVAREMAEEVEAASQTTNDLKAILERVVKRGSESVARTPDLLPILKKAGVVDSGGRGLVIFFEGMLKAMRGESVTTTGDGSTDLLTLTAEPSSPVQSELRHTLTAEDERGYGYDVQYIIKGEHLDVEKIRADIIAMGDSTVVVGTANVVKVHVHVHDPGVPISYGVALGVIADVVVENMQEQSEQYINRRESEPDLTPQAILQEQPPLVVKSGDIAVIAVAPGDGWKSVFRQLGVAAVVLGGQTMNPSVADFLSVMQGLPTDEFILLPNNKNVVLTAQQAAKLGQAQGLHVAVLPTVTVPQGIAAMLPFDALASLEVVVDEMRKAYAEVTTGEITRATRAVEIDGVQVADGQLIGLVDGKLVVAMDDIQALIKALLNHMHAANHELITLYYGAEVSAAQALAMLNWLQTEYANQAAGQPANGSPEFQLLYGGQPYYDYILSAE